MRRAIELWPSMLLRRPSVRMTDFSDRVHQSLIYDLLEMVQDEHTAGISAVQVGVPLQVFVVAAKVTGDQDTVFINPSLEMSGYQASDEEGCLSFPGQVVKVVRPAAVEAYAMDRQGQPFTVRATGFYARCIQHEYDHLQGVTLFDKASFAKKEHIKRALRAR